MLECDAQLPVQFAGARGGNPKNVGLKAGLDNFAPRLGAIYRLNTNTVVRTGYGVTFNNMGWGRPVRGDLQYPITLATTFQRRLILRIGQIRRLIHLQQAAAPMRVEHS